MTTLNKFGLLVFIVFATSLPSAIKETDGLLFFDSMLGIIGTVLFLIDDDW